MYKTPTKHNKSIFKNHIFNVIFTILTVCCLPFISEISESIQYNLKTSLIILTLLAIIIFSISKEIYQYKQEQENEQKHKINQQNERAKTVLTQVVQLIDRKANDYRKNTYELKIIDKDWPYFYGVHNYLHEVCENLKTTVAKIIQAESNHVDVSLIYRYCSEQEWKWLSGRSGISDMIDLNEFIKDSATLYHYVLHHKSEAPVFCNDKSDSSIYKPGRRDSLFNGKGSFYAMPITFCNNKEALVEAVLLISTYGVNFIPLSSSKEEENEFRRILAYEVVPYYISIIQSELGALYMRHNLGEIKVFPEKEQEQK